jgi:hypothetical protein
MMDRPFAESIIQPYRDAGIDRLSAGAFGYQAFQFPLFKSELKARVSWLKWDGDYLEI